MLPFLLLGVAQAAGLLLVPLGSFGIWFQLATLATFAWWTEFGMVGPIPLLILIGLAIAAEVTYAATGASVVETRIRRRAGFAALALAGAGAAIGTSFPLVGSLFGALLGAFLGALLGLFGVRRNDGGRSYLGALLFATTLRISTGVVIAAFTTLVLAR